ncbi:hypothetical protein GLX30_17630 [Streptomyces sp. Tu 2975]|uniref:hypothetical protein n=1 Tax=Streptomyces sp. Tu 2975 TaxID=2676871 RepID=UPI001359DFB6|nr:hypothetical protein [Streptomyces sp. Tu 2975]QIP85556.1 hypothetical protein GLX30_17630 [Streptomyces sp. Tu 2975]
MTPALRTRCAITVASLLLLATPVAHAGEQPRETSPEPSVSTSLAGRQAGEGRQRPGRRTTPSPSASVSPTVAPSGSPAAAVSPSRTGTPAKSSAPASPRPREDEPSRWGRHPEDTTPEEDGAPETEAPADAWNAPPPGSRRSEPAAARHQAPRSAPVPVAHQISPLSLGIGMALMGLGIGFLGMRLRRR